MDEKQTAALHEAFERKHPGFDLTRDANGEYEHGSTSLAWHEWLACYQHLAPQLKDAARYQWLRDIDNEQEAFSAIHEFADKYLDEAIDAAIDRKNDAARDQEKKTC